MGRQSVTFMEGQRLDKVSSCATRHMPISLQMRTKQCCPVQDAWMDGESLAGLIQKSKIWPIGKRGTLDARNKRGECAQCKMIQTTCTERILTWDADRSFPGALCKSGHLPGTESERAGHSTLHPLDCQAASPGHQVLLSLDKQDNFEARAHTLPKPFWPIEPAEKRTADQRLMHTRALGLVTARWNLLLSRMMSNDMTWTQHAHIKIKSIKAPEIQKHCDLPQKENNVLDHCISRMVASIGQGKRWPLSLESLCGVIVEAHKQNNWARVGSHAVRVSAIVPRRAQSREHGRTPSIKFFCWWKLPAGKCTTSGWGKITKPISVWTRWRAGTEGPHRSNAPP